MTTFALCCLVMHKLLWLWIRVVSYVLLSLLKENALWYGINNDLFEEILIAAVVLALYLVTQFIVQIRPTTCARECRTLKP